MLHEAVGKAEGVTLAERGPCIRFMEHPEKDRSLGFRFQGSKVSVKGRPQRAQYPLIKEYSLNHNLKAPII